MLRLLVLLHRWLGVVFCLPMAMWFATGIVMHFVPFPATLPQPLAAPATLEVSRVVHGPREAIDAGGGATRVRLFQRADGPIYLVSHLSAVKAFRADNLGDAAIRSETAALAIATDYAGRRGWGFAGATVARLASYDQWILAKEYEPHRPLYRIALGDDLARELYVSSTTGEVILETTRRTRGWSYVGSIAHWLYFTPLRSHGVIWSALLWWLSLFALIAVAAGAVIGTLRIERDRGRLVSPFRGWQAAHHWLGLMCMPFIFTWMLSGCLSMDDGALFSSGKPTLAEEEALTGVAGWRSLPPDELRGLSASVWDVEWFTFSGRIFRRERQSNGSQRVAAVQSESGHAVPLGEFLPREEIDAAFSRFARNCEPASLVAANDDYAAVPAAPGAPVFRVVCGGEWFEIDGSNGAVLAKLDGSRRWHRWLQTGLHRLDFPFLATRPTLRTVLLVLLCACGLIFSVTANVIAWRRIHGGCD
jgi:PepSY-associated TM region